MWIMKRGNYCWCSDSFHFEPFNGIFIKVPKAFTTQPEAGFVHPRLKVLKEYTRHPTLHVVSFAL
jgi:hypothetical protein